MSKCGKTIELRLITLSELNSTSGKEMDINAKCAENTVVKNMGRFII
jgi:hypothetical protein